MKNKYKIKHKKEGWTGTLEIIGEEFPSSSSHSQTIVVTYLLIQDSHKPDGIYVEDPDINSLEDLEIE